MTTMMTMGPSRWLLLGLVPSLVTACPTSSDQPETAGTTGVHSDDSSGSATVSPSEPDGTSGATETSETTASATTERGSEGGSESGSEGGSDDRWDCLGQVGPPAWVPGVASVQFTVVEFPAAVPLGGLMLEVCDLADIDCTTPADSAMTSAAGEVEVAVSTEASSYFQVTGEGVVDSLFFRRNVPPPSDPYVTELGALSPGTLGAFIALTGAQDDAMRGHLIVTARDCDEALAEGVVIEVDTADEAATVAYLDGGLPSTETRQTDESGRAGVLNLPAGPTVVTTRVAQTGAVIGVRTIFVRPGQLSLVGMIPTER